MSDDDGDAAATDEQLRRLRLVGYGIVGSGFLTLLVATVSTRPHGILVVGLGALAVATLVLETTQGGASGLSLGFLSGSFGVWLWPHLDGGGHYSLGLVMIGAGAVNVLLTPHFHRIGRRLADR